MYTKIDYERTGLHQESSHWRISEPYGGVWTGLSGRCGSGINPLRLRRLGSGCGHFCRYREFRAVAAHFLRAVERLVGEVQEGMGIHELFAGAHGNAAARGYGDGSGVCHYWLRLDRCADAFRQSQCSESVRRRSDYQELFATVASHVVVGADAAGNTSRCLPQDGVAGEMAVRVVDVLEAIEVEHNNAEGAALADL